VPASAVFPLPDKGRSDGDDVPAAMGVFTVQDGRARLRPVEVIARNSQDAWLRQGLQAGDAVIVYAPASVRDGVRVTARTR
jgi:HlyD family secretion protein